MHTGFGRRLRASAWAAVAAAAVGCAAAPPPVPPAREVFALCGAANRPPMEEIAAAYEESTGVRVQLAFGGSGALLSQNRMTGKGDVYVPSSPDFVSIGVNDGSIVPGSDTILAYLVPTILVPKGNPAGVRGLEDLARPGVRVALAHPEAVAVGLYAVEILEAAGLLEPVLKNVVTFGENVEKTTDLVARGTVDATVSWSVCEAWNPARMEAVPIPPERIPRISYVPIALLGTARDEALARAFIAFVASDAGRETYRRHGYFVDRSEALARAPRAGIGGAYRLPDAYRRLMADR